MTERSNLRAVHEIFAAFARNDLSGALEMLAEDVDWCNLGPAELGYTAVCRGREQVREFFAKVDALFSHDEFEPQEFIAEADKVVVTGRERVTVRANGVSSINSWCMVFTFRGGKIARWRCYEDTARVLAAMRGKLLE